MAYSVITPPATEPVTLAEVREFLQLGADTSHDSLLTSLIQSAREGIEQEDNRALINQTIEQEHSCIPRSSRFTLLFAPVSFIESVRYYDSNEAEYNISHYVKNLVAEPATVTLTDEFIWPTDVLAVRIRYRAGYASASMVPARLKQAMMLMIRSGYDERSNKVTPAGLTASERLRAPWKVWHPDINI